MTRLEIAETLFSVADVLETHGVVSGTLTDNYGIVNGDDEAWKKKTNNPGRMCVLGALNFVTLGNPMGFFPRNSIGAVERVTLLNALRARFNLERNDFEWNIANHFNREIDAGRGDQYIARLRQIGAELKIEAGSEPPV